MINSSRLGIHVPSEKTDNQCWKNVDTNIEWNKRLTTHLVQRVARVGVAFLTIDPWCGEICLGVWWLNFGGTVLRADYVQWQDWNRRSLTQKTTLNQKHYAGTVSTVHETCNIRRCKIYSAVILSFIPEETEVFPGHQATPKAVTVVLMLSYIVEVSKSAIWVV